MTSSSDLSKCDSQLEILKRIVAYPGEDVLQTVKDHIQTIEEDKSVLMAYRPRDLKTIISMIRDGSIKDSYCWESRVGRT